MSFDNTVTRNRLFEALQTNDKIELDEVTVGPISYYIVKNVFKDPYKAIEVLKKWPVVTPPDNVYTPGGRQHFTPMDLFPLCHYYSHITKYIIKREIQAQNFITASNVVDPDPMVWENSWHPHVDHDLVFNLWLCDWTEGTGLFNYKDHFSSREYEGVIDQKLNKNNIVKWRNPKNENGFKHYHTIPCLFNSVAIYDGKLFHGTIMGEGTGSRYSLISFYHESGQF